MQLEDYQIVALRNLADSSAWKVARDTVLKELIHGICDVNVKIEVPENIMMTIGEAYAAKVAASHVLNELISTIDRLANSKGEKDAVSFE